MIKISIQEDPMSFTTSMWIWQENADHSIDIWKPIEVVTQHVTESDGTAIEPTLRLERRIAQEFMQGLADGLIAAGYRDKSISKDGEISRLERHLEDMRSIVIKKGVM